MEKKGLVVCGVLGLLGLISAATGFGAEATRIKFDPLLLLVWRAITSLSAQHDGVAFSPIPSQPLSGRLKRGFMRRTCNLGRDDIVPLGQAATVGVAGSQVHFTSATQCVYPRSPALGLGLTAAVALLLAQTIIHVSTGCICCRRNPRPSSSSWRLALVCYVISCITYVIAFLLLLTGAALNDQHGEESMYFGNYYCYVVKPGVFAGGAILSLASAILGIVYYVTLNSAKNGNEQPFGNNASVSTQSGIAMGRPQFVPQNTQEPVFVHEDTYMRRQFT